MYASLLQLAGLLGLTAAAIIEFGVAGGLAGVSIGAIYLGLAADT